MTEAECYKSKEGWQEKYLLLVFNRLFLIPSDVPPGALHTVRLRQALLQGWGNLSRIKAQPRYDFLPPKGSQ